MRLREKSSGNYREGQQQRLSLGYRLYCMNLNWYYLMNQLLALTRKVADSYGNEWKGCEKKVIQCC
jgi:hypothetical protein